MNLTLCIAKQNDHAFFWQEYVNAMYHHIDRIWGWDDNWQQNDFANRWQTCDNQLIMVDGQRAGYIQSVVSKQETYIMMLILSETFRGKGVGKHVLSNIKDQLVNNTLSLRVFRTNVDALSFYLANGFSIQKNEGDFLYLTYTYR